MGIYDRDYYREDSRWHNPLARSKATLFLVLLFGFFYIAEVATVERKQEPIGRANEIRLTETGNSRLTEALELNVSRTLDGEVWRIVTYALAHPPFYIFHIIVTAVFLVWIGHQVEDLYGSKEYLAFFAVSTLLGGVAYLIIGAITGTSPALLGPSGAVTAVLVLFALHYPTRTMTFRFFIPIPVWLYVAIYAFFDIFGLAGGTVNPALVAVHLTGAAFAFIYHTYTLRMLNWLPGGNARGKTARRVPQPRLRVTRDVPEPEPAAAASSVGGGSAKAASGGSPVDEHLEAKLDEVLEKVAKFGKESLTDGEREILLRASEVYKKRRRPS
ncbi:MAG TPA: rhomboid family intramembrane serine protease [Gemmataceae bacterium]|jgi:membrane associated rhomboid family serine protease|nr:rhomboid family intramembrane serine protease [Gemmataceae bacterium]